MDKLKKRRLAGESGQALLEVAISASVLFLLVFGVIDVSRALYYQEVMKMLTGEGSSMASRGTSTSMTALTVMNDAGSNLNLSGSGCVIVTAVINTGSGSHPLQVQANGQSTGGSCTGIHSKIGCAPPQSGCGNATLPSDAVAALGLNQSLYVTEIYYRYSPVTPVGGRIVPAQLYDVAYY